MKTEKNDLLINLINLSVANKKTFGYNYRPKSDKFSYPQDRLSITFNVEQLTDEDKLDVLLFVLKHKVCGANGTPSLENGFNNIDYVDFYEIDDMSLEALNDLVLLSEKINKSTFFYEYFGM